MSLIAWSCPLEWCFALEQGLKWLGDIGEGRDEFLIILEEGEL